MLLFWFGPGFSLVASSSIFLARSRRILRCSSSLSASFDSGMRAPSPPREAHWSGCPSYGERGAVGTRALLLAGSRSARAFDVVGAGDGDRKECPGGAGCWASMYGLERSVWLFPLAATPFHLIMSCGVNWGVAWGIGPAGRGDALGAGRFLVPGDDDIASARGWTEEEVEVADDGTRSGSGGKDQGTLLGVRPACPARLQA